MIFSNAFISMCRTSHEVRGLKSLRFLIVAFDVGRTSHEVRGLKYFNYKLLKSRNPSHLTRGAWIEIFGIPLAMLNIVVAPHTRCVD